MNRSRALVVMCATCTAFAGAAFAARQLVTAQAGTPVSPPAETPFVVGVVRGDGVMLPIAWRDGSEWRQARTFESVDRGIYRIRVPQPFPLSGWTLHVPNEPSRPLALIEPVTVGAHCARQEGFSTDARPAPDTLDAPHRTWAIATSVPATAAALEDVRAEPDEDARRVVRFLTDVTTAVENERLSARPASPLAAVPAAERTRVAPAITTLVRDRLSRDRHFYYFEAQKVYPAGQVYASGWVESSSFRLSLVRVGGGVDTGGESARPTSHVLGTLRGGPNSLWVVEQLYYEGTGYDIVEMGFTPQLLSAGGGGC